MSKHKEKVIITPEEPPVERGVLASAIVEISSAMRKLLAGGITRDAVIILVSHKVKALGGKYSAKSKPSIGVIRIVFDALAELEKEFCD